MKELRDPDEDRRDVKRTRILRNAKIILERKSTMIHCTVQNITSGGACLKVANTYGLPETFELTFEHGRTRRACRVAWRTNDLLGVAFVAAEETVWRAGPQTVQNSATARSSRSMSSGRDNR